MVFLSHPVPSHGAQTRGREEWGPEVRGLAKLLLSSCGPCLAWCSEMEGWMQPPSSWSRGSQIAFIYFFLDYCDACMRLLIWFTWLTPSIFLLTFFSLQKCKYTFPVALFKPTTGTVPGWLYQVSLSRSEQRQPYVPATTTTLESKYLLHGRT